MSVNPANITRDQISQAVGGNPRAIRLLEALIRVTGYLLPQAIEDAQLAAMADAQGAKGAADRALGSALELRALVAACQRQAADLGTLRGEVEALRAELTDARSRLSSAVSKAQADVDRALTLSIGI